MESIPAGPSRSVRHRAADDAAGAPATAPVSRASEAEFAAWLRAILANEMLQANRFHRQAKRSIGDEQSLHADLDQSSRRLSAFAGNGESPSAAAVFHERALAVSRAVESLPAAQREAIVLHYWQGLTVREISQQLDATAAAVGGLIHRGLKALKTALADSD
ncbi:MAG: sigma-70 family RNA polymerase sigma factor [Planctomyces sp.]|nr:sigma-70 family RNA polymerase sigma factor [Planctomyces sp.]